MRNPTTRAILELTLLLQASQKGRATHLFCTSIRTQPDASSNLMTAGIYSPRLFRRASMLASSAGAILRQPKEPFVTFTYALLLALFGLAMSSPSTGQTPASTTLPLQALVQSYPDFLDRIEGNELVWKDGTRMIIDDARGPKDLETRLNAPDIKDMFYELYPSGRTGTPPSFESDPGRVRFQPLFDKMYGNCLAGEVEARLVEIDWMPGTGASQKLKVNKG